MKLIDFLNKVMYKGKTPDSFNDKQNKAFGSSVTGLSKAVEELKEIENHVDQITTHLDEAKQKFRDAKITGNRAEQIAAQSEIMFHRGKLSKLNETYEKGNKDLQKQLAALAKKYKLSANELHGVEDYIKDNSKDLVTSSQKYDKSLGMISKVAKNGFGDIISLSTDFFVEFGVLGELMSAAFQQMLELNKVMVQFNREMGQGFSNNMLGMDLYGSNERGSIQSNANTGGVEVSGILNSLKAFSKGNAMGNTDNFQNQQEEMNNFALKSAQLSKFYGVHMETVNKITGDLVYNFGAKVKDLNGIFEHGKKVALEAGISVSDYFEKLKEATDQLGEHYISGGIRGLENLAEYAAKTNQSVGEIMKSADRFKNYTSLYMEQNLAAAHGMNETAKNTKQIWAMKMTGDFPGMDKLYKGSLAKDVMNRGMVDKNGNIDQSGTMNLQQMGLQKDEIQAIQRIIKMQKEAGITMEQWLDPMKQSLDVQKKINQFEQNNLTVGEKLTQLWGKIRTSIIDPLASIMGPVLDGLLSLAGIVIDVVAPVLRLITWPLQMFGKLLGKASAKLQDFELVVSKVVNFLNPFKSNKDGKEQNLTNNIFFKGIGAVIGAIMTVSLLKKAGNMTGGIRNWITSRVGGGRLAGMGSRMMAGGRGLVGRAGGMIGSAGRGIGGFFGRAGTAIGGSGTANALRGAAGTGFGSRLLSGVKGGIVGAGVGFITNQVAKTVGGKTGDKISTVGNDIAMGAMIGSLIPGIGTAVGAGAGALFGIVHASADEIGAIWSDTSKGFGSKIIDTAGAIVDTVMQTLSGLTKWIKKIFGEAWDWISGKEEKAETFKANQVVSNANYVDPQAQIRKIMEYRKVEIPMAAEHAQEKRMQKEYNPSVHVQVNTTFDKAAKVRVSGKGE